MAAADQISHGALPPARTLTLDDVAGMAAADDADRFELDEGTLLMMAPVDVGHGAIVMRLTAWLLAHGHDPARPEPAYVAYEPVRLDDLLADPPPALL